MGKNAEFNRIYLNNSWIEQVETSENKGHELGLHFNMAIFIENVSLH